jgi:hypothetical protein
MIGRLPGKLLCGLLLGSFWMAVPAKAGFIMTLKESGGDVIGTGSGSFDLSGLEYNFSSHLGSAGIVPSSGFIVFGLGTSETEIDAWTGLTMPPDFGYFGPGNSSDPSSTGDLVGVLFNELFVPAGYVSGTALSNTATFSGASFSSLGVTPGTYIWGLPNDTFTLEVGADAPEPGTWGLLGIGIAGLMLCRRLRSTREPRFGNSR